LGQLEDFYDIVRKGLNGLIPIVLKLPLGTMGIYLGPSRSELVIIAGGEVIHVNRGITKPIKVLLKALKGEAFKSKEFLIAEVWGYSYDPSIHDKLLHATIGKLRALLGDFSQWIEWSNDGYKLANQVAIFNPEETRASANHSIEMEAQSILTKSEIPIASFSKKEKTDILNSEINVRQLKLVNSLKPGDFISVKHYAKRFRVCTMTACRDLSNLHHNGRVLRIGKGRATVYGLP
jgi:DNA-binding winged helix-turn-helix (wHTH) protein